MFIFEHTNQQQVFTHEIRSASKRNNQNAAILSGNGRICRNNMNEDVFFTWQVEPTVIFGRNQLIETEVDIEYCKNTISVSSDVKVAADACMQTQET